MAKNNLSYQDLKQKLEQILSELQHEDTDLDKAIELHKEGQVVLKQLEDYLSEITSKDTKAK